MIRSQHLSQDDLVKLIQGDDESDETQALCEHLHQCQECREALDALTANTEIWQMAPRLLGRVNNTMLPDTGVHLPVQTEGTSQFSKPKKNEVQPSADPEWKYPIEALLDPPQHPEMMGRIGDYDIECEVGRGGMGVVLKAHDSLLNRPLAIKILAPHLASHGTARKRFAQEAIAAAGVLHPNVIAVHGVSNEGRTPFMVMPFVAGPSLQTLVDQNGPLTEIEMVRIVLQISAGLAAAHSQGLVHRDIKPANILVEAGVNRVLITDFGLARAEDDASLTQTGWLTGTPNYMSPEQARGDRPDQRSDLFSLGSLIYFLATGRLPFRAETPLGVLRRIQNENPTPVRQVNNQVSPTLADVIEKLLRKKPEDRFQSSAELHELLERHLAYLHQPDVSKPPKVNPPQVKKGPLPLALLCCGLAVALMAFGFGSGIIPSPFSSTDSDPNQRTNPLAINSDAEKGDGFNPITMFPVVDEIDEEEARLAYESGIELMTQQKVSDAAVLFRKASGHYAIAANANYNFACCLALLGESDKAFSALNMAVDSGFDDATHFAQDEDFAELRDDDRFQAIESKMSALHNANEMVQEAIDSAKRQEFERSEQLCRNALELDANNERALLNLGYALHMQNRLDDALMFHQRASQSKRFAAVATYNLCCISARRKQIDQAFDQLDNAIDGGLFKNVDLEQLQNDPDLENLRSDERYAKAVEKFRNSIPLHQRDQGISMRHGNGTVVFLSDGDDFVPQECYPSDQIMGNWEVELNDDSVQMLLRCDTPNGKQSWGMMREMKLMDFAPALNSSTNEFVHSNQFGTVTFQGKFEGTQGKGTFKFTGNEEYRKSLADRGIKPIGDAVLFRYNLGDIDEAKTLANVKKLQKLEISLPSLRILMIDGIDADDVQRYLAAKLSVEKQLRFLIYRVPADLLVEYKSAGLDLIQHQTFILQRVPADLLIEYMQAGYDLNDASKFIAWRIGVDLLKAYQQAGLDAEEHSEFINQRVPASLVLQYKNAGFDVNRFRKYIGKRIPFQVLEGYQKSNLSIDKYDQFVSNQVPANLVLAYLQSDFDLKKYENFLLRRIEPGILKSYSAADLSLDDFQEFIFQRVPVSLLLGYRKFEYDFEKYQPFLEGRVDPNFIKSYELAGLDPFDHVDFIRRRVEPAEVLRYREGLKRNK